MNQPKPFAVSKRAVWEAYKKVKANRGAAGVDGQSIEEFEQDLSGNLYKLWNRLASGSYMPPAVRCVEIPKATGGTRPLGIPTVADRIGQMVVKDALEPILEPCFHHDSYGYRPNKSAHDALAVARQRCWRAAWVLDVDIKGFFDNIDHALLMKAVRKHIDCRWITLYIERWLTAPVQLPDGTSQARNKGTPQGGVISPLLANLFLHYVFDMWMVRNFPANGFERYADDVVIHSTSLKQVTMLRAQLTERLADCKLEMSPGKTKIVYCKDKRRKGGYPEISFDFLGYTFGPRKSRAKDGSISLNFLPAISGKAAKAIRQTVRDWSLHRRTPISLEEIARRINPVVRGWVDYYGRFYRSKLCLVLSHIDLHLAKWIARKHKRVRKSLVRAYEWLRRIRGECPELFAHWRMAYRS
ncbi:group II intron reverse transcriptase/maturase [Ralstonia solanacearum]|uniref:group II intron reverse transcriptase/maturase n=1 Tax=Ralstonia solanacearum TaxID=305 RepID=UPI0001D94BE7|nr:group II intron reverse transcriptase/maturase [Ralstonia solanacearum]CBJ49604.1 putative RNA-directed DNA polymerase [Ralstonia solanacearum PSI07]